MYRDVDRYFARKERELRRRPKCCECGEHIQTEYCFEVNGEYICEDCMNDYHRVCVDDLCE